MTHWQNDTFSISLCDWREAHRSINGTWSSLVINIHQLAQSVHCQSVTRAVARPSARRSLNLL